MSQRNVDDDLDWQYAESKFEELRRANALLMAWAPVIEAAKAYVSSLTGGYGDNDEYLSLVKAVEALLAAEKGE
jgi:hypothetical protein